VLELSRTELGKVGTTNQGKHNVSAISLLEEFLYANTIGRVEEDACVLWSYYGLNDLSEVVHVGKSLDAKKDVIEGDLG